MNRHRRIPLFFLAASLVLGAACARKPRPVAPPPAASIPPDPSALPAPPAPPPASAPPAASTPPVKAGAAPGSVLGRADADYAAGRYATAARRYSGYLSTATAAREKDRVLYRLAVSTALTGDNEKAARQAEPHFQRLISTYPKSPYVPEARLIVSLLRELQKLRTDAAASQEDVKRLTAELERLKKIDLERRPPRVP